MTMTRHPPRLPSHQRGVAAIEFALVSVVMMLLLTGILGLGSMFWIKQQLSNFAGEGARAALYASQYHQADWSGMQSAACRDVNASSIGKAMSGTGTDGVTCTGLSYAGKGCPTRAGTQCIEVKLTYDVAGSSPAAALYGLIRSIPLVNSGGWLPKTLAANAVLQIR